MREPRADEVARALLAHLRGALAAPALDLAAPASALSGGFDTEIFALTLRGAPPALSGPLVLRLSRPHHDPARVLREAATQNAVADLGYPAPRVLLASAEPHALGAPFMLMERLPGRPLLEAGAIGMGAVLAAAQARLHALDAAPLARALGPAGTLDGYLETEAGRIARATLDGLRPLLDWLRARRPRESATAICHGDFHPQNILVDGGRVSGVLDWPNAIVADPLFDVASTLNIVSFVSAGITSLPAPVRWLLRAAQPILVRRYLASYRRLRPVDAARLAYYQVAAGLRALVRAGESRRRGVLTGLDASPYATRLLAHACRVTGVEATLPS